ncbi:SCP2 sterol-binding domain-containing protein [Ornithinibacillus halophilus]|uniref:SCP-2 sterol transfer family protein n=1 Tax=Ornithinibacillus halophilus TaxID=930117 RepID=A0A1M5JLW7_9BACI|nr:SCP2 sterol-binding domain-containing protein [Ornithinibacillus halophilus]SHG41023.1 SCP-2 sterol transfer family protein [Ornithinibacillus halophilus]
MSTITNGNLKEIWELIESKLEINQEPYQELKAVYEFQLTDHEGEVYQLEFENSGVNIHTQSEKVADCTLKMKEKYFRKFLLGDLNSTTAFMTGKLKVDGNIGMALKLEGLLKKYNFTEE